MWFIEEKNDHVEIIIQKKLQKMQKKIEFAGLQFYQKVVISFIWLSTLMSSSG